MLCAAGQAAGKAVEVRGVAASFLTTVLSYIGCTAMLVPYLCCVATGRLQLHPRLLSVKHDTAAPTTLPGRLPVPMQDLNNDHRPCDLFGWWGHLDSFTAETIPHTSPHEVQDHDEGVCCVTDLCDAFLPHCCA
jgi:hypothetical protein